METEKKEIQGMPPGAFEVLPPGETYVPYVPAEKSVPETTTRSLLIGLLMAVVFSSAAAFLGLKIGQVFEAAIPIAIIAVGLANVFKRRSTILENVIIQSIGSASGVIVAGAIFTLPAIFILDLDKQVGFSIFQIFMVSFLGGMLGILFLIPFRRYFVKEMHGHFPFPEATATTQILVAGEKGGRQSRILLKSMAIGGLYDFLVHSVGAWNEVFTSRVLKIGATIAEKAKIVFKLDVLTAVLGLGYIIGLRYTAIICAGSLLSWFFLIPLVSFFGHLVPAQMMASGGEVIAGLSAEEVFRNYVRFIGIGAIAMAGIIGIIKSAKIIAGAFRTGFRQMSSKRGETGSSEVRTDIDISMKHIMLLVLFTALVLLLFFHLSVLKTEPGAFKLSAIALLTVFVISFLFTSVAARAIAIVGTNPVSGMTMMTLILSSVVLVAAGLSGPFGMMAALLIGGVVCTSLAMSGAFISDLKIGYWLGATPLKQQLWKFSGTFVSALAVGFVILLLNETYGFNPADPNALPAPQANAMAALIQPLMNPGAEVPWLLYLVGAGIALVLERVGVAPLAFALGMYIPLELNTPLLVGGLIAFYVQRSHRDRELTKSRHEKGILIASGFIAGGAIMGVVSALVKYLGFEPFIRLGWDEKAIGEPLALFMFIAICLYLYFDSLKAGEE